MVHEAYNREFARKVGREGIPTCRILNVDIAAVDMEWLLNFTRENIHELEGDYMCVSNVHTAVTSYEDKEYCRIQNGGIMAIPDGAPLSSLGRRRGFAQMKRTTGPDYMERVLRMSEQEDYRHYFYGSTPETLKVLRQKLADRYPRIQVCGMHSPPFRAMTEQEDAEIVKQINKTNPDFVWVGLGAPKQERWMAEHQGRISGFMVGVGAAFDYFAGNISRAPDWMQRSSLEWMYRLMQDPKRLFYRYFHTNTKFLWEAVIKGK